MNTNVGVAPAASSAWGWIAPGIVGIGADQQSPDALRLDALDNPFIEQFLADGADHWAEQFDLQSDLGQQVAGERSTDFLSGFS